MARKLFTQASVNIPTAGTRVQISASETPIDSVVIQAQASNTGLVWVGDSDVAANRGIELSPGQAITLTAETIGKAGDEYILSDVWVDTATNGNDVNVAYSKRR